MSTALIQLLTTIVGVAGTLAAAIATQLIARRNEHDRRLADDQRRWDEECLNTARSFISDTRAIAKQAQEPRQLMWAEDDTRREALTNLGIRTLYELEDAGALGLVTSEEVADMREHSRNMKSEIIKLDTHIMVFDMLADPALSRAAKNLQVATWDVIRHFERFFRAKDFTSYVIAYGDAEHEFTKAVRMYLRRDLKARPTRRWRLFRRQSAQ